MCERDCDASPQKALAKKRNSPKRKRKTEIAAGLLL
jgi:hypothetical protein